TPGDIAVRRNSDQMITARVIGMRPEKAQLFAHYERAGAWEPVAMQPEGDAGGAATYQFVLSGLPENVEYYVRAGPLVSPHYKVRVVDLPAVKSIRVTYQYPKWTGMKPVTEEHSGDLRAIEGTDAAIEIEMDHPLKNGQLALDDGQTIHLDGGQGDKYQATIRMQKDGAYHIAASDQGQTVRLSEDYFIATDKAQPPQVAISRPGGDYRSSPIEEVTVGVKAEDQFGLKDLDLHYSVNGGEDHDVSLLKSPGAKNADGSYTLPLEDYKLVPGDLVSLYATAKDGHSEARTDITFIQADPFEREFSQSQQRGGGGGGGSGQNQIEISRREKELIAATWKQQNDKSQTAKDAAVAGQFLSDAQQKLRDQVMALSARMESRDLSQANEEFTGIEKDMETAARAMAPSADKLKQTQWKDAIPLEQKALQALLHAEATFRRIEIAFGQQGGGGGGTNSAGRDLASLFDLELDTEKNQYETAESTSPQEQHQKDVDDALAKLDALAKRQEELANHERNPQQSFEERWQQEMLRREAEQLERQLEQLARNKQGQQENGQESSGQSGSEQQSSGSKSGRQAAQTSSQSQTSEGGGSQQANGQSSAERSRDQRIEQALRRLHQAGEAMKRSGSSGHDESAEAARQAAKQLREAMSQLGGTQQQLASGKLGALSREADRLRQEERAQADRINKLANQQDDSSSAMDRDSMMQRLRQRDQLAGERQQLSDDLSKLGKNLRDAARDMVANQPGVAQKLRDALTEMDQSDLDNHTQRTADWLRGGVNPNSNGTENEIAQGLEKLSRNLHQAQQAMGQGKPGQPGDAAGQQDQSAMIDQIRRLRSQLDAMSRGQQRNQNGRTGGEPGNGGRQGARRQDASGGLRAGNGVDRSGDLSGDIRYGGGGADSAVLGNINTGNNRYGQGPRRPVPLDASGNPPDVERTYQQDLEQMNHIRQMVAGHPETAKEVSALAQQMKQLDPSRFPGNPAMVERMHREVLSSLNRIELELEHDSSSDARTKKPSSIPAGYQDSVAEYYRRLSKNP
ncbi:MAG: hypothetical protein J2P13_07210, partial [Acidobacteria bacterium]|nr:hypothetical protein [Acidobacteriota bacterium]